MLEYVLSFYNNYTILFYILLTISVIIEGPIIILSLSLIAPKLGFGFSEILLFAFIGNFGGDLLHYTIGRFIIGNIFKNKKISILKKAQEKLKNHSLFNQLIVIKYTPIITNIGLLYLGYKKTNLIAFIKTTSILAIINEIIITTIGFNFGYLFKDKSEFSYFIILLFLSFLLLYLLLKIISNYIIKFFMKK